MLYQIGKIYDDLGNFEKSTSCLSESVKIMRSQAEDNEMVGRALGCIGRHYAHKKKFAKAVELCTESLRLLKQFSQASDIAESLLELGNILKSWGKTDQALQFYEESLRTYEEATGIDSIEAAICRYNIGLIKKQLGESETALQYFGAALRTHREKDGDKSLGVADNLFQIGQIFDSFGSNDKAQRCFDECLKIREEVLGEDHLDTLAAQRLANKKIKYNQ